VKPGPNGLTEEPCRAALYPAHPDVWVHRPGHRRGAHLYVTPLAW